MSTQITYSLPEQRTRIIMAALDFVLEQKAGILSLQGRLFSSHDAFHAVRLSHEQSQGVVESALAWLSQRNVHDIEIRCIEGHHVLLDTITGKFHDLEMPGGCRSQSSLPGQKRAQEFANLTDAGAVSERHRELLYEWYASDLLAQRDKLASRAGPEQTDHDTSGTDSESHIHNGVMTIACLMVVASVFYHAIHLDCYLAAWTMGVTFAGTIAVTSILLVRVTHCHDF